ncbi:MAG TPA: hypothetical protein DCY64_06490 [Hydrogenophaga sp.]|jgi:hypothetical protein|uniref:hypothetical protein n=1 Tax=Hydrogenophaga sp. TaxID=1904254 RepID=UPI0008AB4E22|nr:hypothetical protein [Hydrogenophaga sp.]OGA76449.1 MAG: hypothetical protein A2X73_19240 [Burkholderiales bacterium GWE1_65_30]OGA91365.1 MAG: hypothetical protein A2X72_04145 [Burkholderiales bacterium GWF1_66_17]OGB26176.1 MAG: hypothetical protein A3B67_00065 [Burkholderiales bacterium RIFCSPHIGHO2_02_FULL_66_10]MDZ4293453.1 hypothetical protein [Hydrogenophaga sp.]HAX19914.1 hypothetical protein [Hydrogenophaga sp.]
MNKTELLSRNRVIHCHFDDYSHALLFPRWAHGMLWPQALPEGAEPMAAPATDLPGHEAEALKQAVVQDTGLNPDELDYVGDFKAWFQTPDGPLRVHLLRFNTPDAPKPAIAALGGTFKALSELRGGAMAELLLLREAFTLVGGGKG